MRGTASKLSVVGLGSREPRKTASALFRIPVTLGIVMVAPAIGLDASSTAAAVPGACWSLDALATPSSFSASDNTECLEHIESGNELICDAYRLTATNVGSTATGVYKQGEPEEGEPIPVTLTDTLPAGVTVRRIEFFWTGAASLGLPGVEAETDLNVALPKGFGGPPPCTTVPLRCSLGSLVRIGPDDSLKMVVYVTVNDPGASGALSDEVMVAGGGAPAASRSVQNEVGVGPPAFGFAGFSSFIAGVDGAPDRQAGDHPYGFTTRIDLTNEFRIGPENFFKVTSVREVKDVVVDLPLGLLGSALAAPECTLAQLSSPASCPLDTQVGHLH